MQKGTMTINGSTKHILIFDSEEEMRGVLNGTEKPVTVSNSNNSPDCIAKSLIMRYVRQGAILEGVAVHNAARTKAMRELLPERGEAAMCTRMVIDQLESEGKIEYHKGKLRVARAQVKEAPKLSQELKFVLERIKELPEQERTLQEIESALEFVMEAQQLKECINGLVDCGELITTDDVNYTLRN